MDKKTLNLLILENNPDDAELSVKELEREGLVFEWKRVETEKSFKKALTEKPDLILADYNLPSFDGMAAIKLQQEIAPEIPLILISGTIGEDIAVECMKAGVTDYVLKDRIFRLGFVVKRALKEAKEARERKLAEEALQESEKELKAIFNGARDGIALLDKTGKILRINKYIVEIGGFTEEELVGKRFSALKMFPLKSMSKMITVFSKLIKGQEISYEVEVNTKKGEKKIVQLNNSLLKKDGKVEGVIAILRDVTKQKRTDEKLRESDEKYSSLIANIPDVIWSTDIEGNTSFISSNVEKVFGFKPEEIYETGDKLWFGRIHPDDIERVKGKFKGLFEGKNSQLDVEYRIKRKDGEWIWLNYRSTIIYEKNGIKLADGLFSDITDRKQAEEGLKNSEERLKILFESAPDAYYLNDLKGTFIDGNKAAEDLMGYKKEELIGKSFLKLKLLSAKELLKTSKLLLKNVHGKGTGPDEFILNRKDGSQVSVEILTYPVKIKDKTVVLDIARDITKRKKTEEDIKKRNEELKTFNKMAVGRELRMVKLKKEINGLLEKLGKKSKYSIAE